jgi:hypothetical protein
MKSLTEIAVDFREQYPKARDYQFYTEIPPESMTEGFLIAWVVMGGDFSRIPHEQRTELMKRIAVKYDARALAHITPEEVEDYQSLIVDAVNNFSLAVDHINESYITEGLVVKIAKNETGLQALQRLDLNGSRKHLLTDFVISSIVQIGPSRTSFLIDCLGSLGRNIIRDEDIKIGIKNDFRNIGPLISINKIHLLAEVLKSGYWPDKFNPETDMTRTRKEDISTPPVSPVDIMNRVIEIKNPSLRLWHFESFRCFPLEEVIISTLGIPNATDFIMRVYSEDELRPHLRLSRELRGKFLEVSLGL